MGHPLEAFGLNENSFIIYKYKASGFTGLFNTEDYSAITDVSPFLNLTPLLQSLVPQAC